MESLRIASECLKFYAVAIPFNCIFILNGRFSESFQKLTLPSLIGTIANFLSILSTNYFVNKIGYLGIPISKLAVEIFYCLPFGFIMVKFFLGYIPSGLYKYVVCSLISCLISGIAIGFIPTSLLNYFPSWLMSISFLFLLYFFMYSSVIILLDRRMVNFLLICLKKFRFN